MRSAAFATPGRVGFGAFVGEFGRGQALESDFAAVVLERDAADFDGLRRETDAQIHHGFARRVIFGGAKRQIEARPRPARRSFVAIRTLVRLDRLLEGKADERFVHRRLNGAHPKRRQQNIVFPDRRDVFRRQLNLIRLFRLHQRLRADRALEVGVIGLNNRNAGIGGARTRDRERGGGVGGQ